MVLVEFFKCLKIVLRLLIRISIYNIIIINAVVVVANMKYHMEMMDRLFRNMLR